MLHIAIISAITVLGLTGFNISSYIRNKKISKKKLVCPMRSNCDTVIHSDHSQILGIPVEVLGIIYYAFISSVYSIIFIFGLWSMPVGIVLVGISMFAVLFSIYLVSMQAFVIKHWCTWCLFSAFISFIIFGLSYLHFTLY